MRFDPKEMENCEVQQFFGASIKKYHTPISPRENYRLTLRHKGEWMPTSRDKMWFCPEIIPDNPARAFVIEAGGRYQGPVGGKDLFGIDWEYVPSAHGSIVRPGNPTLTDISRWQEVIHFPDLDSFDWEGSALKNREYLQNCGTYVNFCVFTGWFERLISFMDFGPAALAVQRSKTRGYVKELFEKITDLWIDLVDHVDKYYGHDVDGFAFHDDWGSQSCPFFHVNTTEEMLVPYMKRVTDHIHSLGYTAELHSCGKIDQLVPCIIAAGWDSWDGMAINDYSALYEKYGDQLVMNIPVPEVNGSTGSEGDADADADLKTAADAFTEKYADKTRPASISAFSMPQNPAFADEIYRVTRMKFGE